MEHQTQKKNSKPLKRSEFGFLGSYLLLYAGGFLYLRHYFATRILLPMTFQIDLALLVAAVFPVLCALIPTQPSRKRWGRVANALSWGGNLWMGFLFSFLLVAGFVELFRWGLRSLGPTLGLAWALKPPMDLLLEVVLASCLLAYGCFEAHMSCVERLSLKTDKMEPGAKPIRIVQISDLHLGLSVPKRRIQRIVKRIAMEEPDLIVSTGDFVDGEVSLVRDVATLFRRLKPTYGKFAVTGNHEFYAGIDQARSFTERCGFVLLEDEKVDAGGIRIIGASDPGGNPLAGKAEGSRKPLLHIKEGEDNFVLLLRHRPDVHKEEIGRFDLQLSGHVHKGQVFPFNLLARLFYRYISGLNPVGQGSLIYVSRGTGTWGPPIRFGARPEITVIDIVPTGPSRSHRPQLEKVRQARPSWAAGHYEAHKC